MTKAVYLRLRSLAEARARATSWLVDHVESDGRPKGAEIGNGWSRLSWALALGGETAAASTTLEWALREAIGDDGIFRSGAARGSGLVGPYFLGQLAMGALHLERHDVARVLLDGLERMQDDLGGIPLDLPGGRLAHISDMTSTAQAGQAALLGGRFEMARRIRDWLLQALALQPDLPHRLYVGCAGGELVTAPPPGVEWLLAVDYRLPRQAYYYSGIAAAFLGAYAMQTGDAAALAAGHQFLDLNIRGTEAQFTDLDSVQICKFGWGAAIMQIADPEQRYDEQLLRMSDWFVERQDADGSWTPSRFQSPTPTIVERMMKTAEHSMEVTALMAALATGRARNSI